MNNVFPLLMLIIGLGCVGAVAAVVDLNPAVAINHDHAQPPYLSRSR